METFTRREWSSESGAEELAKLIALYWIERGWRIRVWIERAQWHRAGFGELWCVRTDMVNGAPVVRM